MSRWLRWQYIVPRLLACVVAALSVQFAAGIVIRSMAMRCGAQLLGSHTEVAAARVSLADGHVLLGRMRLADPRDADRRWLAAECGEVELEAAPLLARQAVITRARLDGVRFEGSFANGTKWFHDHSVEAARNSLASATDRFDEMSLSRLESVRRTADFCTRWPDELAALDARAAELERNAGELERNLGAAIANELRHDSLLDKAPANADELRNELASLCSAYDNLPQRLEAERRSIVAARRQDEQLVRDQMRGEKIDAQLLNAYLLREPASRQLDSLFAWLRWTRRIAPEASARPIAVTRGEDVLFAGVRPMSGVLLRSLELRGEADFFGRPIPFRGLVSNLATTPTVHGEPIRLWISSTDATALKVRATIDRTHGRLREELVVEAQEVPVKSQSLGYPEQLHLEVAPSTGTLTVSVNVDRDKLSGEIQLVQKRPGFTTVLKCQGKNSPIGESLEQSLRELDLLTTRMSLKGTIDRPSCELTSNLGPAVAAALARGLQQHADARTREVLADAQRQVDERLADVERQLAERRKRFAIRTAGMPDRIDAIARSQTRRERMSSEQLGRRLPTTSIVR